MQSPKGPLSTQAQALLQPLPKSELPLANDVTPAQTYANKLFEYLTGAPKPLTDPRLYNVVVQVNQGNLLKAAQLVIADPGFLNIRVRAFSIPFIDVQHQPDGTLTDLQAMIIGVTRDEIDARQLLTGDFRYSG